MPVPIIAAGAAVGARAVAGSAAKTAAKSTLSQGARSASQGIKPINVPADKKSPPSIRRTSESGEVISRAQRMRNNQNEQQSMGEEFDEGTPDISKIIKYRIGLLTTVFFVGIALFLDLLELIADIFSAGTVGTAVDVFQTLFFIPAFWLIGAPFWKGRKVAKKVTTFVVSTLVSYIPIISSILPEITIAVIITIYLTRQEDKENTQISVEQESSNITRYKRERPKIRRV